MPETKVEAMKWSEKFPFSTKTVTIDAKSFQAWADEFVKPYGPLPRVNGVHASDGGVQVGECFYAALTMETHRMASPFEGMGFGFLPRVGKPVEKRCVLSVAQAGRVGKVCFDDTVYVPALKKANDAPWMSLTPMEVMSQRAGLRKARGRVMVAGMGLGWLARRVAERKNVKKVTVVERDPSIAKFFGDPIVKLSKGKVDVVVECAFDYCERQPMDTRHDTLLFDTWADYGDARWDSRYNKIKERYPRLRVWGWGDVSFPSER